MGVLWLSDSLALIGGLFPALWSSDGEFTVAVPEEPEDVEGFELGLSEEQLALFENTVKTFQSTNANLDSTEPCPWNMKVSAGRTPPVLGLENSPMWLILGPVHTSQKAHVTATERARRVEFVVETVTSVVTTLKLAITTRELGDDGSCDVPSQVAKNVWMVYSQLTRTVTASMIAVVFLVASIQRVQLR